MLGLPQESAQIVKAIGQSPRGLFALLPILMTAAGLYLFDDAAIAIRTGVFILIIGSFWSLVVVVLRTPGIIEGSPQSPPLGEGGEETAPSSTRAAGGKAVDSKLGVVSVRSREGRDKEFQELRQEASLRIFIVGIAMSNLAHDTRSLKAQARHVPIDLFVLDPQYLEDHPTLKESIAEFLDDMHDFEERLNNSIQKLAEVCREWNGDPHHANKMSLRAYRTIPSMSMVAIDPTDPWAKMIVEFFFYRSGTHRPRLLVEKSCSDEGLFQIIHSEYRRLWEEPTTRSIV